MVEVQVKRLSTANGGVYWMTEHCQPGETCIGQSTVRLSMLGRGGGRRATVLVTFAFVASSSCAPDTTVFRFLPEEGAVYRVREVEEVRETTTARAGIGLEREEMEARIEVRRPDSALACATATGAGARSGRRRSRPWSTSWRGASARTLSGSRCWR